MEGRGFAVLQVFFLFSLCDLHYVSLITLAHVDWHEQHSSLLPSFLCLNTNLHFIDFEQKQSFILNSSVF